MDQLRLLIEWSRGGDLEAYGRLVERFQDMVYGYARATLGDRHLAEDAAQEAFIEAYRSLGTLEDVDAFPAWLRRIVFRRCRRLVRGKAVATVPLKEAIDMPTHQDNPSKRASDHEMAERVLAAIRALPKAQREATTLFYVNGYSQGEIAGFLQLPVNTVKSRLHAARATLSREVLDMVGDILETEKPKAELPRRVLSGLITEAEAARKHRDAGRLVEVCDDALGRMEGVKLTAGQRAKRAYVLTLRGEAKAHGQGEVDDAASDYEAAWDEATEIGDTAMQGRACRGAIVMLIGAGQTDRARGWAKRGVEAARALPGATAGRAALRGVCEAALVLCRGKRSGWMPYDKGGFVLGWFDVEQDGDRLVVASPRVHDRPPHAANVLKPLRMGTPVYSCAISLVHHVLMSMPAKLKGGARGKAELVLPDSRRLHLGDLRLKGTTRAAQKRETVEVAAGRFLCWKLTTKIEVIDAKPVETSHLQYTIGSVTGEVTTWLAPGGGMGKLELGEGIGHRTELELQEMNVGAGGGDGEGRVRALQW